MLRTRVGYCGGTKNDPTYYALGDHTEAIAVDFDPAVISYEDLLARFWNSHHCGSNTGMRQYRNAVFYNSDEQRRIAEASRTAAAEQRGIAVSDVRTAILPAGPFTYAEKYHQKYALTRHHDLRAFLDERYPDAKSFADSTVATRLNAWLGSGFDRKLAVLQGEIGSYGLSEKLQEAVLSEAERRP